jgi:hypothetical protein
MIRKSMPSGYDPMGGHRFSEKIMLKQKIERDDDSKKSHPALKDWRRISMRYDRCAHTFFRAICIAATAVFWLGQ